MRCRVCDYRLWNLKARTCPECGTAFKPSDFDFMINAVAYACPHCGQRYYGTDSRGHLVPREFDCVACGQHVHMDEMILLPTTGVREEQTQPIHNPWLARRRIGRVKAWFSMIGKGMIAPVDLIRSTPVETPANEGSLFVFITLLLFNTTGLQVVLLMPFFIGMALMGGSTGWVHGLMSLALGVLLPPTVMMFMVYLWSAVTHALLRLSGATVGGYGRTLHAITFSAGVNVFTAIPCLGFYAAWIGWVWWIVASVLMVQQGQRVSGRRATWSVLALPIVVCCLAIGGAGVVVYKIRQASAAVSAISTAPPVPVPSLPPSP